MNKNKEIIKYSQSGFTLIELLVVIAVIGILSAIVLTALGSARTKGNDAAVKSGLNQTRVQADLFYTNNGNYTNVCALASNSLTPRGINSMVLSSGKANGYSSPVNVNNASGAYEVRCNDAANGWAAEVPLKGVTGYYCVDYTRKGIVTAISIGATNAFCQ